MSTTSSNRAGFLELLKESEALARGANLTEKIHHAVYRSIKSHSSIEQIRNGHIFNLDTPIPELQAATTSRKDVMDVLQRLISDQLIAQVFLLRFHLETGEIRLRPGYIAHTGDDRVGPVQLFNETIFTSATEVESLIDSRPVLTAQMIRKDLETDFKSQNMPDPSTLKILIDPLKVLQPAAFDLVPPADLLREGRTMLREELTKRGLVIDLINYGFLPVRDHEILTVFETASDFMVQKLIPTHKSKGNLKAEIESINQQQAAHTVEVNEANTSSFTAQKAAAIKKTILSQPNRSGGSRFSGSLAIEIILQLSSKADSQYSAQWDSDINQIYADFVEPILAEEALWFDMVRFVTEEERMDIPSRAWNKIVTDTSLLYSTWQTVDGTVHVLARKDVNAIKSLLSGMLELGSDEQWKILAIRFLIEQYESVMPELFESSETIALYGKLLRRVYMQYIPWYIRLLMFFGLKSIQDYAFKNAKDIIFKQQEQLETVNSEQKQQLEKKRLNEKKRRLEAAHDLQVINRIVEKIDHAFQEGRTIPLAGDIRQEFSDMQGPDFYAFLDKHNFQLISKPGSQGPQDSILLYPVDHNWRVRVSRLRRRLEELLSSDQTPADIIEQLRLIEQHIQRTGNPGNATSTNKNPDDAYKKFEKAVYEHEHRGSENDDAEPLEL